MTKESYWTVAQTVSKMEHLVRRDIEKANHGAFLPTCARFWKVDDRQYAKERPLFGGYVFFLTKPDDWAGIPDIHGVYRVPVNPNGKPMRVSVEEMARVMIGHAAGDHNESMPARFTKYYRPLPTIRKKSRKPRPGKRARPRNLPVYANQEQSGISQRNGDVVIGLSAGLSNGRAANGEACPQTIS